MKLIFATSNKHKLEEIRTVLSGRAEIISKDEAGWSAELPETGDTLVANALEKATTLSDALDIDCFAEDTGLEIDALDSAPGVISARYAGPERNAAKNMAKVLDELGSHQNRGAQFRAVMALNLDGASYCFEGIVRGTIATEPRGVSGFGYDPIFIPDGFSETFGELSAEIKNTLSHRVRAAEKMLDFLESYDTCRAGLGLPTAHH